MNKVYQLITDQIIEKLEAGTVPWRMPWSSDGPKNLTSGKAYRGINILLLGSQGYANPYWLTFKQAKSLGGHVKKGAKSTPVVFWKTYSAMETNDEGEQQEKGRFVLRYFRVFNLDQCELPADKMPEDVATTKHFDPIPKCEQVAKAMPNAPAITHQSQRACYSPLLDIACHSPRVLMLPRPTTARCSMS